MLSRFKSILVAGTENNRAKQVNQSWKTKSVFQTVKEDPQNRFILINGRKS